MSSVLPMGSSLHWGLRIHPPWIRGDYCTPFDYLIYFIRNRSFVLSKCLLKARRAHGTRPQGPVHSALSLGCKQRVQLSRRSRGNQRFSPPGLLEIVLRTLNYFNPKVLRIECMRELSVSLSATARRKNGSN